MLIECFFIINNFFLVHNSLGQHHASHYYGKYLGSLSPNSVHSVKGKVYAVNETAIFIEDFSYDGAGPGNL